MANYQLLNNVDHKDLRIIIDRSAEFGDDVWFAATFPSEFRNLQRDYPIFFTKHPETGKFEAVAVFGFEDGENLFLGEHGWHAGYIPLNIMRMPFLIGFQEQTEAGETTREPVITVDMDSPRVNTERGEPVFLEHGGNSPYIEQISSILKVLQQAARSSQPFFGALEQLNLIESLVLDVKLDDGSENRLSGFYTINEDALRELEGDDLAMLNRRGYLEAVYMVIASMSNIPDLIAAKNKRNAAMAADG
ncbi:MAG: multidrug transporter [Xanthomonadales bacterium]|nr:multidrug transporter [Xanthomonadales bacterium]NIN59215.1 multidrug transporter [Xanthomonadales bacterium]NIN74566.1 multidrug transporter [Xanthomonadales bacterium]NIO13984.1 multidrug transporter [Xanthomonadales bacterium]NIP11608.1 multidrug transporter [Xanthomonadales bacterium]